MDEENKALADIAAMARVALQSMLLEPEEAGTQNPKESQASAGNEADLETPLEKLSRIGTQEPAKPPKEFTLPPPLLPQIFENVTKDGQRLELYAERFRKGPLGDLKASLKVFREQNPGLPLTIQPWEYSRLYPRIEGIECWEIVPLTSTFPFQKPNPKPEQYARLRAREVAGHTKIELLYAEVDQEEIREYLEKLWGWLVGDEVKEPEKNRDEPTPQTENPTTEKDKAGEQQPDIGLNKLEKGVVKAVKDLIEEGLSCTDEAVAARIYAAKPPIRNLKGEQYSRQWINKTRRELRKRKHDV